ncbi:MAG: hypothetical protein WDO18_03235 [Acidobacteriota bacterium]
MSPGVACAQRLSKQPVSKYLTDKTDLHLLERQAPLQAAFEMPEVIRTHEQNAFTSPGKALPSGVAFDTAPTPNCPMHPSITCRA